MRRRTPPPPSLRLCALLALLTILWALAGAPLTPAEWRGLPDRLALLLRQIPRRMLGLLARWLPV